VSPWSRRLGLGFEHILDWILFGGITHWGILASYSTFTFNVLEPFWHKLHTWHLLGNLAQLGPLKWGLVGTLGRMEIKTYTLI
jgi:hypothetical protein